MPDVRFSYYQYLFVILAALISLTKDGIPAIVTAPGHHGDVVFSPNTLTSSQKVKQKPQVMLDREGKTSGAPLPVSL